MPEPGAGDVLVLAQASTPVEEMLVRSWLERYRSGANGAAVDVLTLSPPAAGVPESAAPLTGRLADGDTLLLPVRVAWLPEHDDGPPGTRWTDVIRGRDPYRPTERQQRRIVRMHPGRARVVCGDAATVAELRRRWADTTTGGDEEDFAAFVTRRAALALERADCQILGPKYKTPQLVKEEILASARFYPGLSELARGAGDKPVTPERADELLDELITGWSRRFIDIVPNVGRLVYRRGFDPEIDFDDEQVERLRTAMQRHPGVLLWSHRSNLDSLVLTVAMQEKGLPRAHLFAGINMAFGPLGMLMRRAGVIFIRRQMADDPLYRYVLKEYIGYVVEKRFNLSWSIEGTRSRTGKMLPPKLGLLTYVADAYLQGRSDDVLLFPVSITFDQLHEITEYAQYASGAEKAPEGMGWLYRFIKAQGARHYGKVYIRFAEPVSMAQYLTAPGGALVSKGPARRLALQKLAFEAAWRINQVTPVTGTALLTTILLATRGMAVTFDQVRLGLADALGYMERRSIPRTSGLRALSTPEGVSATLDALCRSGLVTASGEGRTTVWAIGADQQLAATFYRNSLIQFVLETAICELALCRASEADGDHLASFWAEALRLRDLLKFEFYFQDRAEYQARIAGEMRGHRADWEEQTAAGSNSILALLSGMRPLVSHFVLRPYFEAYCVVADILTTEPAEPDRDEVVRKSLGLGRQWVAQQRLRSTEPVSVLLFKTALQLADNQQLLVDAPDLQERRAAFLEEFRALRRRLDRIERLAVRRFVQDSAAAGRPFGSLS